MRRRTKIILSLVLVGSIACFLYVRFSPLAIFARRVSDADRAIVTETSRGGGGITITGEDLRRVMGMVSSAHRDTKPYDCSPIADVKFFKGNALLGQMTTCVELLWIDNRQYRDDTGLLESLVVTPLLKTK
jgi:hypothetical protein